jgi:hypothetical protein
VRSRSRSRLRQTVVGTSSGSLDSMQEPCAYLRRVPAFCQGAR